MREVQVSEVPVQHTRWNTHDFPDAAKVLLEDSQTRKNVQHATNVIQGKRNKVTAELPDWEDLREAGAQVKAHTLRHLDYYLTKFDQD